MAEKTQNSQQDENLCHSSNSDKSTTDNSTTDEEIWEDEDGPDTHENQQEKVVRPNGEANAVPISSEIGAITLFILVWQSCFGIPGSAIAVLLKFLKKLIIILSDLCGSAVLEKIGENFPITLATGYPCLTWHQN